MGFVIIVALGLYFLLSIGVVAWAVSYAKKHDKSTKRWGWGAALGMYLLVFWDWIPTVLTHQYYCATEAGFWVYKTPQQWLKENPGVMETLVDNSPQKYPSWPKEAWNEKKVTSINQRFGLLNTNHFSNSEEGELFLHQWRWTNELLDKNTGEILARNIDFSSGNGLVGGEPELKFWLHKDSCSDDRRNTRKFSEFLNQFRGRQQ
jgi:hypothetical protein